MVIVHVVYHSPPRLQVYGGSLNGTDFTSFQLTVNIRLSCNKVSQNVLIHNKLVTNILIFLWEIELFWFEVLHFLKHILC